MKFLNKIVQFIKDWDKPVELNEGEVHCDWCDGSGWVMHHMGDCQCGKCHGEGKLIIKNKQCVCNQIDENGEPKIGWCHIHHIDWL